MALYYGAAGNRQRNVRLEKLVPGSALALLCCIVAPPLAKLTFGLWVNLDGSTILNSQIQLQWLAAGTLAGTLGGQMSVSNAISTASWRLQACRLVGRYIKRRQRGSKASGSYQQMPDSWRIRLRKKPTITKYWRAVCDKINDGVSCKREALSAGTIAFIYDRCTHESCAILLIWGANSSWLQDACNSRANE